MSPTRDELIQWDRRHVWHPFTPHSVYADEAPLMVVAGEGNELIDVDGNRYLDGVSSLWCNVFGHRHPKIDAAVRAQLDQIAHATLLGNATATSAELAYRLTQVAPDALTRVFFSDNGSTAVESALKIALQYWQQADGGKQAERTRFITLTEAYHGDTVGAVSLGGIDLFHERYGGLLFDTIKAPAPHCYRCPLGLERATCGLACIEEMEALIAEHGPTLAGVFMEPAVQGAAGMIIHPPEYLERVARATKEAGALLILDEVAVGFGRSGETLFACQQAGVSPDLLCVAKGLTGGYLPVAATLATEAIFQAFLGPPEEGRTFFHGHTYTGNALGAAAALATLDLFEEQNVLAVLPAKVRALREALTTIADHPHVGEIRQWGMMVGVELVANRETKETFPSKERRGMDICRRARAHGVFLRPLGDVIIVMPPLSITFDQIEKLVGAIRMSLEDAIDEEAL